MHVHVRVCVSVYTYICIYVQNFEVQDLATCSALPHRQERWHMYRGLGPGGLPGSVASIRLVVADVYVFTRSLGTRLKLCKLLPLPLILHRGHHPSPSGRGDGKVAHRLAIECLWKSPVFIRVLDPHLVHEYDFLEPGPHRQVPHRSPQVGRRLFKHKNCSRPSLGFRV
jgi:hypothetical protein